MRQHIVQASIAAAVAAAISGGVAYKAPAKIEQVVHSVNVSKHAWPDLTSAQKAALAEKLADEVKAPFVILCGNASCNDLAEDIDDAAENAKVPSVLDRPVTPLGYGIGVEGENGDGRAEKLAAALREVTGLEVDVTRGRTLPEYPLFVLIGKYRAPR
jgi:hypothetical protein